MGSDGHLFCEGSLHGVLDGHQRKLSNQIDSYDQNKLLNSNVDDLVRYFVAEGRLEVPAIRDADISVDQVEINMEVIDYARLITVKGTQIQCFVPFTGDPQLFRFTPSSHTANPPFAQVQGQEVVMVFNRRDHDAAAVKADIDRSVAEVKRWLVWVEDDVKKFNEQLPANVRARIEARRQRLLRDAGMVASLGFPMRRRPDAPATYVEPSVRRKPEIAVAPGSSKPFKPEPILEMDEYDRILGVMSQMVQVMERSPKAFKDMGEEDLRSHFLVQLNGQYQGQATGETFNYEGKTDILIRAEARNIFIGECKFWKGAESLQKAIDQVLGYTAWRDTKAAVLVFNRNKNFSGVLGQIPGVVKAHPCFKKEGAKLGETSFRHIFRHRDDPEREIVLTVMAFDVPSGAGGS